MILASSVATKTLACQEFTYIDGLNDTYRRMGHAMVIRNESMLIIGGSDGFLHNEVIEIPLPSLVNETSASRDTCRGEHLNFP